MVLRELRVVEHQSLPASDDNSVCSPGGSRLALCSACRGDYEDPDVSPAGDETPAPSGDESDEAPDEEFSA